MVVSFTTRVSSFLAPSSSPAPPARYMPTLSIPKRERYSCDGFSRQKMSKGGEPTSTWMSPRGIVTVGRRRDFSQCKNSCAGRRLVLTSNRFVDSWYARVVEVLVPDRSGADGPPRRQQGRETEHPRTGSHLHCVAAFGCLRYRRSVALAALRKISCLQDNNWGEEVRSGTVPMASVIANPSCQVRQPNINHNAVTTPRILCLCVCMGAHSAKV